MSCGTRRAVPCTVSLRLVGWTAPGSAAHVVCRGYPGWYPQRDLLIYDEVLAFFVLKCLLKAIIFVG